MKHGHFLAFFSIVCVLFRQWGEFLDFGEGVVYKQVFASGAKNTCSRCSNAFRQLGQNLIQVSDDAVIRDFEYRRGFVLVDRDDDFRSQDADRVLNLSRYANRDHQTLFAFFPADADHALFREPVKIRGERARAGDFGVQFLRECVGEREIVLLGETFADNDERFRAFDVRGRGGFGFAFDDFNARFAEL